ncbi:hypothetical protein GIB67_042042 [Kingdonia uniflora]|uniref:Uncharacterized protein n=1 Tax=Kingdonia uniflora TaxID=39325 RepID=A0A7J7MVK9_9MAGN|nr:hypothetical protein GIB67_042042 [Kingdonia uniflora]
MEQKDGYIVLHLSCVPLLFSFVVAAFIPFDNVLISGLLDNGLSDYLWAKAILLTTITVAIAGLTIQVPLAAIVDSLTGHAPHLIDYLGAAAVMVGFAGINMPSGDCTTSSSSGETEAEIVIREDSHSLPISRDTSSIF